MRNIVVLLLLAMLSLPAWTQDAEEASAESEAAAESDADAESEPEEAVSDFDEEGLDEQGFSNEDDDFNPSEDIPADQSIDFPADI